MHFMVDFENVRDPGLNGAQYLSPNDSVTLFFSRGTQRVEKGQLQKVLDSGCELDICRLEHTGKNAIDFYIASRIGEIHGGGYTGVTAIVSKDNGFKAVKDYWEKCASHPRKIVLKPDIQQSIASSNENSLRRAQIHGILKDVDIIEEFKKYEEKNRVHSELKKLFTDTDAELVPQIIDIIEGERLLRKIYLASLTRFGRKKGLEIYRILRQIV